MKKQILERAKNFWNDEEAQGMLEYILIAVAVVGIAIAVGPQIKGIIEGKTSKLGEKIEGFDM